MGKASSEKKQAKRKWSQKKTIIVMLTALAGLLAYLEILQWSTSRQFSWLYLIFTVEIGAMVVLWFRSKTLRRLLGEHEHAKRSKIHISSMWVFALIVLIPLTFYVLSSGIRTENSIEPFSIMVVAPTLGGLVLAAASIANIDEKKKTELVAVAQKFIAVTVLFIVFTPSIYLVNLLKIDPNIPDLSNYGVNILGGFYFWIATPSFYVGVMLFLFGLIDLVFGIIGLLDKRERAKN